MGQSWEDLVQELYEKVKESWEDVQDEAGWVSKVAKAVLTVVEVVEEFSTSGEGRLSSEDKANLAADVLNKFIDLPYVPEWIETRMFRLAIAAVVNVLNQRLGNDWFTKLQAIR